MMSEAHLTMEILSSVLFSFFSGFIILAFGRNYLRQAKILFFVSLLISTFFYGSAWIDLSHLEQSFSHSALRWWLEAPGGLQGIHIGFYRDPLGVATGFLASLVTMLFALALPQFMSSTQIWRAYAGLLITSSGVMVSWISFTPWMSILGIFFSSMGGFVFLSGFWNFSEAEGRYSARYAIENSFGLIFIIMGASVLESLGVALEWDLFNGSSLDQQEYFGISLILIGFFVLIRSFPFFGGLITSSAHQFSTRIILLQVFVGWAALSLPVRLFSYLNSLNALPTVGWLAFTLGLVSIVPAFFQSDWKKGFSLWVSAFFCFILMALSFSGVYATTALLLGLVLGTLSLTMFLSDQDSGAHQENRAKIPVESLQKKIVFWRKIGIFCAIFILSGGFGFVSSLGLLRWLKGIQADLWLSLAVSLMILLLSFSLARMGWIAGKNIQRNTIGIQQIIVPFLFILLSIGMIWSGSFSGELIIDEPINRASDFFVLLRDLETNVPLRWADQKSFYSGIGFYLAALLLGLTTSYWTRNVRLQAPGFHRFFSEAYYMDHCVQILFKRTTNVAGFFSTHLDVRFWNQWFPLRVDSTVKKCAMAVKRLDLGLMKKVDRFVFDLVSTFIHVFRIIQSGDTQWYIFFAVGMGIAFVISSMF